MELGFSTGRHAFTKVEWFSLSLGCSCAQFFSLSKQFHSVSFFWWNRVLLQNLLSGFMFARLCASLPMLFTPESVIQAHASLSEQWPWPSPHEEIVTALIGSFTNVPLWVSHWCFANVPLWVSHLWRTRCLG